MSSGTRTLLTCGACSRHGHFELTKREDGLFCCPDCLSPTCEVTAEEPRTEVITIAQIQERVCEAFRVDKSDLIGETRLARAVRPRHIAMFLARRLTKQSQAAIGRRFGGRDHTTVLHAERAVANLCASDLAFSEQVRGLEQELGA